MAQDDLRVMVIGFNDPAGGDNGVGGFIISELRSAPHLGCELRTVEGDCPSGFLATMPTDALVVFLDSVRSNSPPGTVHCLKLPSKSAHPRHLDPEGAGRLQSEILALKQQKGSVPKLFLIGVEAAPGATQSELSAEAKKAVGEIVRNFPRYLKLARDLTM